MRTTAALPSAKLPSVVAGASALFALEVDDL
jgi:hypothetical protein